MVIVPPTGMFRAKRSSTSTVTCSIISVTQAMPISAAAETSGSSRRLRKFIGPSWMHGGVDAAPGADPGAAGGHLP